MTPAAWAFLIILTLAAIGGAARVWTFVAQVMRDTDNDWEQM